ncbi:hypothetical protein KP509_08G034300 [Ceratopteris richardii]|uniref:DUF7036 domain-containing protein n=1 Tax=Ceratopteris richardii TaxID=49495 RepID=A0A8T2UB99_CERRI|nr:hypothetical protein KP509_08G034300 [Ceratopteris richardii]
MGKEEVGTDVLPGGLTPSVPVSGCCTKTILKWSISSLLGIYMLILAVWLVKYHSSKNNISQPASPSSLMLHAEASFRLHRPFLEIQENLSQLQVDLQNEIGIPDTQISIVSVAPASCEDCTEVRFIVTFDKNDPISVPELSLLRDTFVELFMQQSANLSLRSIFGNVTHFEVLQFPGGITVVPPQPGFPLSNIIVLFNFTLHNSLSHVHRNFAKFRQQLANGIILKPNESLFVQLTNEEGSTVNSPVVVQTSILPLVGIMLPPPRLKQLARELIASPEKNLGLNHTLFGRVKEVELSLYLEHNLDSTQSPGPIPSPAPSLQPCPAIGRERHQGFTRHTHQHAPSAAPTNSPAPSIPPCPTIGRGRHQGLTRHRHRHGPSAAPTGSPDNPRHRLASRHFAPAPDFLKSNQSGEHKPPVYAPTYFSSQSPPSASPSSSSQPYPSYPVSQSEPAVVSSGPTTSKPAQHPPSVEPQTSLAIPLKPPLVWMQVFLLIPYSFLW